MNLKNFPVRLIKYISGIKKQRRCIDGKDKYFYISPHLITGDDKQDVLVSNAGRRPFLRSTMPRSDRGGVTYLITAFPL